MGTFRGHFLPGSFFTIFGLWGLVNVLKIFVKNRFFSANTNREAVAVHFRSETWFPLPFCTFLNKLPIDPLVKIIATAIGVFGELDSANWTLVNKNGHFSNHGNFAHVTMFAVFMLAALVEVCQFFKVTTLPFGTEHLVLSLAFFIEGLLFFFHLDGRPVLDKRLHVLLYFVIFATSFVLLFEAWMKNSFLLLIVRVYLILLQGTWFFQIAHSLYGAKPWKDMASNREIIPIIFAWHVAAWLVFFAVCFGLVSLKVQNCQQCQCRKRHLLSSRLESIDMVTLVEQSEQENLITEH